MEIFNILSNIDNISKRKEKQLKIYEKMDERIKTEYRKCPLVVVSFFLSERKTVRNMTMNISNNDSFGKQIQEISQNMSKFEERYEKILENIDQKGVCYTLGKIEIDNIIKLKS